MEGARVVLEDDILSNGRTGAALVEMVREAAPKRLPRHSSWRRRSSTEGRTRSDGVPVIALARVMAIENGHVVMADRKAALLLRRAVISR